ncbi:transporter substrate-binding domain-containing protein [Legionella cardiaca]|uniref:Transporter substrate-binding domain-containing protein n=1 Tax=Legionella cardiaca TaxID=1071983 RepID=A0ABY8AQA0_9GAMM|nr:transporter substrate-binding domain-containing protein [Legionella cardiaca]WED42599.1 transporter substrate-binding domain-containing protein [Legionella cardiaca]
MKFLCLIGCFYCSFSYANTPVTIGIPIFDPPYVMTSAQVTQGFDIGLMDALCERLQWNCKYQSMPFDQLLEAVGSNKVDVAIGSIVITPERRAQFLFSIPYLICDGGFTVLADAPINTLDDLQGKRVGALRAREYYQYLNENFANQFTVVPYDTYPDIVLALKEGKVDAIFGNYFSGLYMDHQFSDQVKILKEHFQVGEGLGIIISPASRDKIAQINNVLLKFQVDGTFTRLYNYNFEFFTPSSGN